MNIKDFFIAKNIAFGVESEDYEQINIAVDAAKAVERATGLGVYIIDYFMKNVIYISENIAQRCGIPIEEIRTKGYSCYLDYIPPTDYNMLLEINDVFFDFFSKLSAEEKLNYIIVYDFHINKRLIHQHFTPMTLRAGKIWLALCTISISSQKTAGNIVLLNSNTTSYYEYSLEKRILIPKTMKKLRNIELDILRFSAQGYITEEIADMTNKSHECIKSYRKAILKKFNANSMAEAIIYAKNHNFI